MKDWKSLRITRLERELEIAQRDLRDERNKHAQQIGLLERQLQAVMDPILQLKMLAPAPAIYLTAEQAELLRLGANRRIK